jgi:Alkali metal cation/H+ antiporter Nha1 C terminus/Sodium/hydrogen exchanger family
LSFFVYYGAIIPWDMMNAPELTVVPWRLVVIAILILLFRRIPIMLALKPIIPDIRTWREALFCGHFGPIGVGAIFISILARAELETGHTVPLATLPTDPNSPNYTVILAIWPIVSFLILSSVHLALISLIAQIIVHGSSIAVFTLGKHLNTLSFTITYTQDNGTTQASAQSGATWASRLPRMSIATRRPLSKHKKGKIGPISAPQDGRPLNGDTLREGGPISLSAIGRPADVDTAPGAARRREERRHDIENVRLEGETEKDEEPSEETQEEDYEEKINDGEEAWREGDNIIVENEEGEVIRTITSPRESELKMAAEKFGKNIVDKFEGVEEKTQAQPESITGRLKRIWSGRKESDYKDGGRQEIDLEQGITEEEENPTVVEKRSSADSAKGIPTTPSTRSPPRPAAGPTLVVDEDTRRTGHVSDRTERRARQERDQETAVERRRREAVLGSSADSDDEGPPHPPYPMLSRNKGKEPESSADEEEDSPDDEAPSSRSQSSSRGAESSASGSQLLSPPPARTRGIRFGDINVGQASFSLEEGPPSTGARHHKTGSGSGDWRVRWNK